MEEITCCVILTPLHLKYLNENKNVDNEVSDFYQSAKIYAQQLFNNNIYDQQLFRLISNSRKNLNQAKAALESLANEAMATEEIKIDCFQFIDQKTRQVFFVLN